VTIRRFPPDTGSLRRWLAGAFRSAAQRLDPQPTVSRDGEGYVIEVGYVALARITPGMISDMR